eukprot:1160639-Pelagomonas_calceolata.AAC.5
MTLGCQVKFSEGWPHKEQIGWGDVGQWMVRSGAVNEWSTPRLPHVHATWRWQGHPDISVLAACSYQTFVAVPSVVCVASGIAEWSVASGMWRLALQSVVSGVWRLALQSVVSGVRRLALQSVASGVWRLALQSVAFGVRRLECGVWHCRVCGKGVKACGMKRGVSMSCSRGMVHRHRVGIEDKWAKCKMHGAGRGGHGAWAKVRLDKVHGGAKVGMVHGQSARLVEVQRARVGKVQSARVGIRTFGCSGRALRGYLGDREMLPHSRDAAHPRPRCFFAGHAREYAGCRSSGATLEHLNSVQMVHRRAVGHLPGSRA